LSYIFYIPPVVRISYYHVRKKHLKVLMYYR